MATYTPTQSSNTSTTDIHQQSSAGIEDKIIKNNSIKIGVIAAVITSLFMLAIYSSVRGPFNTEDGWRELFLLIFFSLGIVVTIFLVHVIFFIAEKRNRLSLYVMSLTYTPLFLTIFISGAILVYITAPTLSWSEAEVYKSKLYQSKRTTLRSFKTQNLECNLVNSAIKDFEKINFTCKTIIPEDNYYDFVVDYDVIQYREGSLQEGSLKYLLFKIDGDQYKYSFREKQSFTLFLTKGIHTVEVSFSVPVQLTEILTEGVLLKINTLTLQSRFGKDLQIVDISSLQQPIEVKKSDLKIIPN